MDTQFEAVDKNDEWLKPTDWYEGRILKTFPKTLSMTVRLTNGEDCYVSSHEITQSPLHIFCQPSGTRVAVRMGETTRPDAACRYRALECHVLAPQPDTLESQFEEVSVRRWSGRWGDGSVLGCGCPIFLLVAHDKDISRNYEIATEDIVTVKVALSSMTNRYIGRVLTEKLEGEKHV
jgi:hypothetical protein